MRLRLNSATRIAGALARWGELFSQMMIGWAGEEVGSAQPPHAESDKKIVGENVKNWQLSFQPYQTGFTVHANGAEAKVVRAVKNLAASERLLPDAVGGYAFWSWVARSDAFPLSQARVCRPLVRCGWCAGGVRCFPFLEGSTGTLRWVVCLQLLQNG